MDEFYLRNVAGTMLSTLLDMDALKGDTKLIVHNAFHGDEMSDRFASLRDELMEACDGAPRYDDGTQDRIDELAADGTQEIMARGVLGVLGYVPVAADAQRLARLKERVAAALAFYEQEGAGA